MSSLGPEYRHSKTQWFVKGNIPAGESGDGFKYGSDIPLKGKERFDPIQTAPALQGTFSTGTSFL